VEYIGVWERLYALYNNLLLPKVNPIDLEQNWPIYISNFVMTLNGPKLARGLGFKVRNILVCGSTVPDSDAIRMAMYSTVGALTQR